ncbi:ATP-binding response regulator [Marinicella meishanensis]|uniref:ATP-binding response regulator n=1 Tax=Marinicella meishanensis TaxID=2873263 RepID=UPI001CC167F0
MSLPSSVLEHIYRHYQAAVWGIITLDANNQISHINPKASQDLGIPASSTDIQACLPLLAAETLEQPFFIPFYNHGSLVFDVHFLLAEAQKYLIFVPIDQVHKQVQAKQQLAHEQALAKEKLQWLFATLEAAHEDIQAANSAKSFYISALSHEMGNPLNAIKGYNELLSEGDIDVAQASTVISNNVAKLETIISQTLDYDQQQTRSTRQAVSLVQLIADLFTDFQLQAQSKGLQLRNQVEPSLTLRSHPNKLQQIFTNLISNAIKYTESGHVTVCTTHTQNQVHVDVLDSGCGMSEAFQRQLFTAWSREGRSDSAGNGIGLVICKMLAEQLGGQLTLQASDPSGSCFRLSLTHQTTTPVRHILLVDDDADCLNLFAFYLSQAGHQVTTASTLAELLAQSAEQRFDTLITDLNLADGRADEAFAEYQNRFSHTLLISANPSQERINHLLAVGFDRVLSKPLSQEDLVNSVSE